MVIALNPKGRKLFGGNFLVYYEQKGETKQKVFDKKSDATKFRDSKVKSIYTK